MEAPVFFSADGTSSSARAESPRLKNMAGRMKFRTRWTSASDSSGGTGSSRGKMNITGAAGGRQGDTFVTNDEHRVGMRRSASFSMSDTDAVHVCLRLLYRALRC